MILLKSPQEIAKMEVANRIVAEVLEGVKEKVQPGSKPGNWMNWRKRCAASVRLSRPSKATGAIPGPSACR